MKFENNFGIECGFQMNDKAFNLRLTYFSRVILGLILGGMIHLPYAAPMIDKNVLETIDHPSSKNIFFSFLIFLKSPNDALPIIDHFKNSPEVSIIPLSFMPVVILTFPKKRHILPEILKEKNILAVSLNQPAGEKAESDQYDKVTSATLFPTLPGLKLWWDSGYQGQSSVIGIIDSGIARHAALKNTKVIINQKALLPKHQFVEGVRSPHGTGVACIYAGHPENFNFKGIAYKTPIILSTIAGEGGKNAEDFYLTYQGLNWLLSSPYQLSVINYSFGNGVVSCKNCPDWSGMAKVADYIINTKKILWVTSAGNNGYIKPKNHYPFNSTMTVPADSYNALTVANMNRYATSNKRPGRFSRLFHAIRYTSSRGPTLMGRKKPDLTAPGNDTFTCAPDAEHYKINYKPEMKYHKGYRLMGGTSSAAPHVGAAIVLLRQAGVRNPMAIKALLINSADTWTDNDMPGPDDPAHPYKGGHHFLKGSEWNSTYGWGYVNLATAYYQRDHLKYNVLSLEKPSIDYKTKLHQTDKVTLVHERRVGFSSAGKFWRLSHLKLQLLDAKNRKVLAEDSSPIDNVHQVSLNNTHHDLGSNLKPQDIIIRIELMDGYIDGAPQEPFVLALPSPVS